MQGKYEGSKLNSQSDPQLNRWNDVEKKIMVA